MMQLQNIGDPRTVFAIEAARYAFDALTDSRDELLRQLWLVETAKLKSLPLPAKGASRALEAAWRIIDSGFRFARILGQIRGLTHRDSRFREAAVAAQAAEYFRNIFQHINSHIGTITGSSNPILGSLAWVTADQTATLAMTVGSLPREVTFATIEYDGHERVYSERVVLSAGNRTIDLMDLFDKLSSGANHLNDWLKTNDYLATKESSPSFVHITTADLDNISAQVAQRYVRLTLKTHLTEENEA